MDFLCKQFSLNHNNSTMKVGTDSILLASCLNDYFQTTPHNINNILDVGTGCGILALCSAQIFPNAQIIAIDIDQASVEESAGNFAQTPWHDRLKAQRISFEDFATNYSKKDIDLIVSNPPYFTNSLPASTDRKTFARHNISLTLEDFVLSAMKIASKNAKLAIILPCNEMNSIEKMFNSQNYFAEYKTLIFAKPNTEAKRKIIVFSQESKTLTEQQIFIRTFDNQYSEEYQRLTSPFLL